MICVNIYKNTLGNHGSNVVADDKCGLHVHFDAQRLADNPELMKNFLRLYAESEELLYKMCNPKGSPIRKNAINRNLKGIHLISSIWRRGMASPTGAKLLKQYNAGTLKVSYKKFGRLRRFLSKYKFDERRYAGLNLTNIGNPDKNTIEFRMANGTLNPEDIKQTVFLYASLLDTAIQVTEHPEEYAERLDSFYQTDITEQEKARRFLNLIMSSQDERQIFMERFESVKDAPVFADNAKKGFAHGRFKRKEFKAITERTPAVQVKEAFAHIKQSLSRTPPVKEGDSYDR